MVFIEFEELLEFFLHGGLEQSLDPALGLLALLCELLSTGVLLAILLLDDARQLVQYAHLLIVV